MSTTQADGDAEDQKTLAAVMAAVQAILDEEGQAVSRQGNARLGAWRTATWETMRGGDPRRPMTWKSPL